MGFTVLGGFYKGTGYSTMVDDYELRVDLKKNRLNENGDFFESGIVDGPNPEDAPVGNAMLVFNDEGKLLCAVQDDAIFSKSEEKQRKVAETLYAGYQKELQEASQKRASRPLPSVSDAMDMEKDNEGVDFGL